MPVHFFASAVSSAVPTEYWATIAASCIAISFLKTWFKGAKLLDPPSPPASTSPPTPPESQFTDLHGRVVLVASGAFTPLGVVTLSALAHRGAQIIALHPDISAPDVVQLIHLIRDSTQSELIYAEQCDLGSLESVSAFAALWNSGDKKQQEAVRRLDALLFLPPGREELHSVQLDEGGRAGGGTRRREAIYQLHVLARFHLVNSLLSSLLVQPPDREVRIVSVVSPFYAAGLTHFDVLAPPPTSSNRGKKDESRSSAAKAPTLQTLSESSYSALVGAASLRWHALTVELQRRVDLLAEADPRPKTKLPGIDVHPSPAPSSKASAAASESIQQQAALRMRQHSNISIINVCTGFERSSDIIETFFPAPSPAQSHASILALLRSVLRFVVLLVLWPFIWLLAKSPATAADGIVWATTRHLEPLSARFDRILASLSRSPAPSSSSSSSQDPHEVRKWQDHLIPGELYREGRIVRPNLPPRFTEDKDAWSQLWKQTEHDVEAKVKQHGGQIKRPDV
ncbi:hypothetical protein EX895_005799 [Sporisorium graminicola]|uniref:Ketoreductase (KR) domain-containing protein n=1 Tax=Sporisorium graminicola TaxID=280036 RepID=A0A4V6ET20_9BASI|nr:hypothetical protein EX895_005799 [Sporisorium graminicola]TKY84719.1 hypothetical protein EX895_005799 [Sporisorium graminicola]